MASKASSPVLDQPGAGLPAFEGWLARWVLFPLATKSMSPQAGLALLQTQVTNVVEKITSLDDQRLNQQVLIKRLPGLEDSSRYWSPAMVVEHLIVTSQGMQGLVEQLTAGQQPELVIRIEDVKPPETTIQRDDLLQRYQAVMDGYFNAITPLLGGLQKATLTHRHPWFGPITAHQWHCLNGLHHRIHCQQLGNILAG